MQQEMLTVASEEPRGLESSQCPTWAEALHDSTVVAALSVSMDERITYANRFAASILGRRSERMLTGLSFRRGVLKDAAQWRHWRSAAKHGARRDVQLCLADADGQSVHVHGDLWLDRAAPRGVACISGVFRDVTQEHRIRDGLARTARLEAVGSLMTGVVHDINNVFTVLLGNLHMAAEHLRVNGSAFTKIKRARDAARRGAELGKQLLAFARGRDMDLEAVNPAKLIANLAPLLTHALGKGIVLKTSLSPRTGTVEANSAQLESAIVNLAINARDALGGNGNITLRVANRSVDSEEAQSLGVPAGVYVQVSVVDDGPGIPAAEQAAVFEPFYSTKDSLQGTGLGLTMVQWLCRQYGGAVRLSSRPGQGATVSMILPRSDRRAADTTKTMPLSVLPTGTEAVLLVAEDENIRWTVVQILESLKYSVTSASSLADVVARQDLRHVDLLLVDNSSLGQQRISDLAQWAQRSASSTPLVVIDDSERHSNLPGLDVLRKPFSLYDLATLVRRALDTRNRG